MKEATKHNAKLWSHDHSNGEKTFLIYCPACKCGHTIPSPRWRFNDDFVLPTFTPSVNITAPPTTYHCHFNITAGKIQFHSDCNHNLKGQLVEMAEIPPDYGF